MAFRIVRNLRMHVGQGDFLELATRHQVLILGLDERVVSRPHQGSHIEHASDFRTPPPLSSEPHASCRCPNSWAPPPPRQRSSSRRTSGRCAIQPAQFRQLSQQGPSRHSTHRRCAAQQLFLLFPTFMIFHEFVHLPHHPLNFPPSTRRSSSPVSYVRPRGPCATGFSQP